MPATRRATLLLPEPAGPSMAMVSLDMRAVNGLETHDVVAAVDVNGFAGYTGAGVGEEEGGGGADFGGVDVALQRGPLGLHLEHVAETGDAARGQRFDGTGGDGVDANILGAEIVGEIAHRGFQRGFGYAHDVVARDNFFRSVVGEGDDAAAGSHQRERAAGDGDERIDADVVGDAKTFAGGVDEIAFEIGFGSETDAVYETVQHSVFFL